MTKAEIIQTIAHRTGLTRLETKTVLIGFWEIVEDTLAKGESVEIRGFGSFRVQNRPARKVYNPVTGESSYIEAKRVPVFKASPKLKQRVQSDMQEA